MNAITLWEPWATLMALDLKHNETRSWLTSYRGELAICAARHKIGARVPDYMLRALSALWSVHEKVNPKARDVHELYYSLPFGCVVCVVDLHDIVHTELERRWISETELCLGDYTPGRFSWRTRNLRRLREPVPVTGRQGLFTLPLDTEQAVRAQLAWCVSS